MMFRFNFKSSKGLDDDNEIFRISKGYEKLDNNEKLKIHSMLREWSDSEIKIINKKEN